MSESKKPSVRPGLEYVVDYVDRKAPFPIGSTVLVPICIIYLLNLAAGVLFEIPDNIPFVGNLDEAAASMLLVWSIGNLRRWWQYRRAQRSARDEEKEGS